MGNTGQLKERIFLFSFFFQTKKDIEFTIIKINENETHNIRDWI